MLYYTQKIAILIAILTVQFSFASNPTKDVPFMEKAMKAINAGDYEAIEGLRSFVKPEHIPELVKKWNKDLAWEQKDGFIMLLMDQKGDLLKPLMEDGFNSPTIENRVAALCVLLQDQKICSSFFDKSGWIVKTKVQEEIDKYRKKNR